MQHDLRSDGDGPVPGSPAVAIVLLAAGLSARMGGPSKLLLDVGGEPMIRRTARNALAMRPAEMVVVTGHRADEVAAALAGLPVRLVFNPDYAEGQQGSVVAGLRALRSTCDAVMVMLGDQPLVTPSHLASLIAHYRTLANGAILIPCHRGRRGNPVLFAAGHIAAVAGRAVDIGCRKLIERHPEAVVRLECEDPVFTQDCDTQEDYGRLLRAVRTSDEASRPGGQPSPEQGIVEEQASIFAGSQPT
ncbi:nucleotidyltransferase family protein [Labrys monachus]|uniref:Molybdenum cofactor cytidylyltransferase n=1 Tax=Labrys monachus TaxID=217067 RepID=A0ABU0F8R9_9HYPH|nr:nucleotidyltransferase family protein [Labrys monachus]MDQ0391016.1 molybdenum cofactor cytidylyltransferase [Labrys monachus]